MPPAPPGVTRERGRAGRGGGRRAWSAAPSRTARHRRGQPARRRGRGVRRALQGRSGLRRAPLQQAALGALDPPRPGPHVDHPQPDHAVRRGAGRRRLRADRPRRLRRDRRRHALRARAVGPRRLRRRAGARPLPAVEGGRLARHLRRRRAQRADDRRDRRRASGARARAPGRWGSASPAARCWCCPNLIIMRDMRRQKASGDLMDMVWWFSGGGSLAEILPTGAARPGIGSVLFEMGRRDTAIFLWLLFALAGAADPGPGDGDHHRAAWFVASVVQLAVRPARRRVAVRPAGPRTPCTPTGCAIRSTSALCDAPETHDSASSPRRSSVPRTRARSRGCSRIVARINELEPTMQAKSDAELRAMTAEFRRRARQGRDARRPPARGLRRRAARPAGARSAMRHYDVQLIGGMVLHRGGIAEMQTGEGKTLVATLPVVPERARPARASTSSRSTTTSPRRDAEWMGRIYKFLGMSRRRDRPRPQRRRTPGHLPLRHHLRPEQRVRLRLPARQHEGVARALRPARAQLRDRRRGRLDPHRRGAHAAHHLRPGRGVGRPVPEGQRHHPAPAQGHRLHRRREGALGDADRRRRRTRREAARRRQPVRPGTTSSRSTT